MVQKKTLVLSSSYLKREVTVEILEPETGISALTVLLMHDGQDMEGLRIQHHLKTHFGTGGRPFLLVAVHASDKRLMEYGVNGVPDFAGRGALAGAHQDFIIEELFPRLRKMYHITEGGHTAAGCSLGGLSAIDLVLENPFLFDKSAVFSGALWWRSKDLGKGYSDATHRIIHQKVKSLKISQEQKFWFQCGTEDETSDRNKNGIIDSIDDTLDLIKELGKKIPEANLTYYEVNKGKHDLNTWSAAIPIFLKWMDKA